MGVRCGIEAFRQAQVGDSLEDVGFSLAVVPQQHIQSLTECDAAFHMVPEIPEHDVADDHGLGVPPSSGPSTNGTAPPWTGPPYSLPEPRVQMTHPEGD